MTEAECLACEDSTPMLESLGDNASNRKLRLFACNCCRRILQHLRLAETITALKVSKQYAKGEVPRSDLLAVDRVHQSKVGDTRTLAISAVNCAVGIDSQSNEDYPYATCAIGSANNAAWAAAGILEDEGQRPTQKELAAKSRQDTVHAAFVRDIFGNPFRPVAFAPE